MSSLTPERPWEWRREAEAGCKRDHRDRAHSLWSTGRAVAGCRCCTEIAAFPSDCCGRKKTRERPARGAGQDDPCAVPGDRRAVARSPPSAAFLFSCPPRIPARAGQGASAARWASSSRRAVSSPVAGLRAAPPRLPDPVTVSAGATGRAAPSPLCFPKGMGLSEIRTGRLAHRRNGQKTRPPRR